MLQLGPGIGQCVAVILALCAVGLNHEDATGAAVAAACVAAVLMALSCAGDICKFLFGQHDDVSGTFHVEAMDESPGTISKRHPADRFGDACVKAAIAIALVTSAIAFLAGFIARHPIW
jgi:hypothetical protein